MVTFELFRVLDQLVEHGVLRNTLLLRYFQELLVSGWCHSQSESNGPFRGNWFGIGLGGSGFLFRWCYAFFYGSFCFLRGGTFNDFADFLFWHDFSRVKD